MRARITDLLVLLINTNCEPSVKSHHTNTTSKIPNVICHGLCDYYLGIIEVQCCDCCSRTQRFFMQFSILRDEFHHRTCWDAKFTMLCFETWHEFHPNFLWTYPWEVSLEKWPKIKYYTRLVTILFSVLGHLYTQTKSHDHVNLRTLENRSRTLLSQIEIQILNWWALKLGVKRKWTMLRDCTIICTSLDPQHDTIIFPRANENFIRCQSSAWDPPLFLMGVT